MESTIKVTINDGWNQDAINERLSSRSLKSEATIKKGTNDSYNLERLLSVKITISWIYDQSYLQ